MSFKNKTKPHNCKDCGTKDTSKFFDGRKTICRDCYNKRERERKQELKGYKMSPEQQKEYIDAPIVRTTPKTVDEALGLC